MAKDTQRLRAIKRLHASIRAGEETCIVQKAIERDGPRLRCLMHITCNLFFVFVERANLQPVLTPCCPYPRETHAPRNSVEGDGVGSIRGADTSDGPVDLEVLLSDFVLPLWEAAGIPQAW